MMEEIKAKEYVVGIRLRSLKVYYFSTDDLDLKVGDWVIVKTVQGTEAGRVAIPPFEPPENFQPPSPLKPLELLCDHYRKSILLFWGLQLIYNFLQKLTLSYQVKILKD